VHATTWSWRAPVGWSACRVACCRLLQVAAPDNYVCMCEGHRTPVRWVAELAWLATILYGSNWRVLFYVFIYLLKLESGRTLIRFIKQLVQWNARLLNFFKPIRRIKCNKTAFTMKQGIHKRMVRFEKLIRSLLMLFLKPQYATMFLCSILLCTTYYMFRPQSVAIFK
jgi:hypothetical protein